jgi:hypothetical protein
LVWQKWLLGPSQTEHLACWSSQERPELESQQHPFKSLPQVVLLDSFQPMQYAKLCVLVTMKGVNPRSTVHRFPKEIQVNQSSIGWIHAKP